ncbi:MAG: ATP-binding cassette domain-containing protein [Acidimicrobiia bacterium]|nr:ATP-binding cassette domain-containing protein [Acidimicrobiia bacterium]
MGRARHTSQGRRWSRGGRAVHLGRGNLPLWCTRCSGRSRHRDRKGHPSASDCVRRCRNRVEPAALRGPDSRRHCPRFPTSGTARVAGFDVVKQSDDVRRNIGVALQDAAIDPLMTGFELLELQAVLYGIPAGKMKQRADDLLERVGLTAAADRRVGTYSGGMRRRLDLALSLIHQPSVLFLDEPTTGLDPMSRLTLWEEVRRLNREGTTVMLTTQYLEEADQLADRIAIIDHGRIVREGKPADLKRTVGDPTLLINMSRAQTDAAKTVLARFGELRPTAEGTLGVGLKGGAERVAEVVRALDEAKVVVEHLELNQPSLDDVFAEATGHRLEGAENAPQAG